MDLTLAGLLRLARFTVQSPRQGARALIGLGLPVSVGWPALGLMAVLSAAFMHLSIAMMSAEDQAMAADMAASPVGSALLQGVVMLILVQCVHFIGRWRGGTGKFSDALILVSWLQFILLCLQVVQIGLQVVIPPLAELVGFAGLALFLWLLTNFVAELHGFRSLWRVALAILGTVLGLAILLAILIEVFLLRGG